MGIQDDEDPWARIERHNRAASAGVRPENADLGDTARWLRAPETAEEAAGPSHEILQLVTASLAAAPERVDLWMMRFDVQKALGLKSEFAKAIVEGWKNPRLIQVLNWPLIRTLWEDLAPGEPVPEGIKLPEPATTAAPAASTAAASGPSGRHHRFADLAAAEAGRELAVLAKAFAALQAQPGFYEDFAQRVAPMLKRPTPLQPAESLMRIVGGQARILLKREDLRHVTPEDEHAAAQAYLATRLGRASVITGNDVYAHSLALARIAPAFQLGCTIVVQPGELEQKPALMEKLRATGARIEVMSRAGMLGTDPREGALRLWMKQIGSAHLALSLGTGPNPYPTMIGSFQSLLGRETAQQLRALGGERPLTLVAAVQSEADSIGFVLPRLRSEVELVFAEPDPGGIASWRPSARLRAYNGAIREHAWLKGTGRIQHIAIPDAQARAAQQQLLQAEKVNVGLEDARAVALTTLLAQRDLRPRDVVVLVA